MLGTNLLRRVSDWVFGDEESRPLEQHSAPNEPLVPQGVEPVVNEDGGQPGDDVVQCTPPRRKRRGSDLHVDGEAHDDGIDGDVVGTESLAIEASPLKRKAPAPSAQQPPAKRARHGVAGSLFACSMPGCEHRTFASDHSFNRHTQREHGRNAFLCPVEGCNVRPRSTASLVRHLTGEHERALACPFEGCEAPGFACVASLQRHAVAEHKAQAKVCAVLGCLATFASEQDMDEHVSRAHA